MTKPETYADQLVTRAEALAEEVREDRERFERDLSDLWD